MQRFVVVLPGDDGGIQLFPMKEWLRQHPSVLPSGVDPTLSTSHQLRNALRKLGWTVQESASEVQMVKPGTIWPIDDDGTDPPSDELSFALEYQLRDFLAQNLGSIDVDGKHLRLFVDAAGRDGIEYPTSVGPIDIVAVDESGAFVVFELKRARSPDHAIGQLARYMGWVAQTIGRNKQVRGIIVAKTIGDKLRYAATVIPNVSLFEYQVEFHVKPVVLGPLHSDDTGQ
ncbi:MAG TPA: endonuclease NucS domain-containing protein [Pirellulales bacterium]|nr:endonuclease NucS domain-containing protein [Pirellulales bacterium]